LTTQSTCCGKNLVSAEFVTKFERKVPLFFQIPNILKVQYRIGGRKLPHHEKIISLRYSLAGLAKMLVPVVGATDAE